MAFILSATSASSADAGWGDSDTLASATSLLASSVAASAALTNTKAETVFSTGTFTLPVNTLAAGDIVRVYATGIATATNAADTLQIRIRIGGVAGTVITASPAIDVANSDVWVINATITCRTAGASGTLIGAGIGMGPDAPSTVALCWASQGVSTAVNTTATQAVVCTGEWSAAATTNSCRLDQFTVTLQKAA